MRCSRKTQEDSFKQCKANLSHEDRTLNQCSNSFPGRCDKEKLHLLVFCLWGTTGYSHQIGSGRVSTISASSTNPCHPLADSDRCIIPLKHLAVNRWLFIASSATEDTTTFCPQLLSFQRIKHATNASVSKPCKFDWHWECKILRRAAGHWLPSIFSWSLQNT